MNSDQYHADRSKGQEHRWHSPGRFWEKQPEDQPLMHENKTEGWLSGMPGEGGYSGIEKCKLPRASETLGAYSNSSEYGVKVFSKSTSRNES